MSMKKLLAASAIGLTMGIISTTATADGHGGMVVDYVKNSSGQVWKNSYGECWRDRFAATDEKLEECGYEKSAAPAPAPVAAAACPDVIVLKNLHFAFDSTVVAEEDKSQLSMARDFIKAIVPAGCHRTETIDVIGHTDSVGPEAYNDKLSIKRAEAVINALTDIGVKLPMNAVGKGELEPAADNSTNEGRAQNRRVVIDINTAN